MRFAAAAMALASLVTVPQHDTQPSNVDPPYVSVSGDGRYVALVSEDHLVAADTNNRRDVYVLDRADGSVALESVAPDGAASREDSDHPVLSHDGRFLAYESGGRIFWRDRQNGAATVLAEGRDPAISGDGRLVAYTAPEGVMLFDVAAHSARNVSVDSSGRAVPNASSSPSLSGDGRYLAFASTAAFESVVPNLRGIVIPSAAQRRGRVRIYIRDLQQGTTRLVETGVKPADGDIWSPEISADGCALAFVSDATNLVRGDRNRSSDVFLLNLVDGALELVSRNSKGEPGNGASRRPAVSIDGRFVAFQSEASDLAKPDADINLLWDVFLFDRQAGTVTRLSTDPGGEWMEASGGPALDASGGVVAFSSRHAMSASDTRNDFDLFVLSLAGRP